LVRAAACVKIGAVAAKARPPDPPFNTKSEGNAGDDDDDEPDTNKAALDAGRLELVPGAARRAEVEGDGTISETTPAASADSTARGSIEQNRARSPRGFVWPIKSK
jgi:hypothetical protein